jgi:hypothetical protein
MRGAFFAAVSFDVYGADMICSMVNCAKQGIVSETISKQARSMGIRRTSIIAVPDLRKSALICGSRHRFCYD